MDNYVKAERIWLKADPNFNEVWVQDRIAEDPQLLGLGKLVLKDRERIQPNAGRVDLLLQDLDSDRRYEVEVQLGRTDPSHIIRTIEYWDFECERSPQYDHYPVIVAEEITGRFFNVIHRLNRAIPLIAIQMNAIKVAEHVALVFVKSVLPKPRLALEEEDEPKVVENGRAYWENRSSAETVAIADHLLEWIHEFDPAAQLNYTAVHIGLIRGGRANNYVLFKPRRDFLALLARIEESEEMTGRLLDAKLDLMDYDSRHERYRIRLTLADLQQHQTLIQDVMRQAYQYAGNE